MPDDFLLDLDIPTMDAGQVNLPSASPTDTAPYEVDVSGDTPQSNEALADDEEAKKYFNEVTEEEALNYLMMLHGCTCYIV